MENKIKLDEITYKGKRESKKYNIKKDKMKWNCHVNKTIQNNIKKKKIVIKENKIQEKEENSNHKVIWLVFERIVLQTFLLFSCPTFLMPVQICVVS